MQGKGNTLLVRADAGIHMGLGHVIRTLALVQAWQEGGGKAIYFQAATTPGIEQRLRSEQVEVVSESMEPGSDADAEALLRLAAAKRSSWIVLDGYHFTDRYQRLVKQGGFRLLLLDDAGDCGHCYADLVLNQDLNADESLYEKRESYTKLLLGTNYVLLRREFRHSSRTPRTFEGHPRTLLVTMGGSDPDNATLRVIRALPPSVHDDRQVVVVIGPSNPHQPSLEAAAKNCRGIHLVQSPPNLPELMARCDVAITAGGGTVWELAYFGVPSIVLVIAENQRRCAERLRANDACLVLDDVESDGRRFRELIGRFLDNAQRCAECSRNFSALVDGRGANRVCEAIKAAS